MLDLKRLPAELMALWLMAFIAYAQNSAARRSVAALACGNTGRLNRPFNKNCNTWLECYCLHIGLRVAA